MLYSWMHKGTVDVQRSVWASCEMNINSPCSPVFQSTEHLLPVFIFVIPVPTHLANKQIEYCHVVCSNVFFRLDFSLCGNILSHRKKLQDSKLISWVGPEQTNYRCENALREATQSGTKGCGQTQLTWHSKSAGVWARVVSALLFTCEGSPEKETQCNDPILSSAFTFTCN